MMRLLALCLALVAGGCDQTMERQHRLNANGATDAWSSGAAARPVPPGTVAQGDNAYRTAESTPPSVTPALMARGRDRYDIFCSECHSYSGDGNGMVPRRGYPHPKSFHTPEARAESAQQLFDTITHGKGDMFGYAVQIPPRDRWAIVAYIRALQLSQHAPASAMKGGAKS